MSRVDWYRCALAASVAWLLAMPLAAGAQEESTDAAATETAAEAAAQAEAGEAEKEPVRKPEPPVTDRPGLERLLLEIQERQKDLGRREADLDERERSLVELEVESLRRLTELQAVQEQLEQRVAEIEAQNQESVARLAKVYAAMPPGRAALLLEELEPILATEILKRMKYKKSAAVLAVMSHSDALRLSRRVARPLVTEASP